jgi:maltose O-acetyltransferase
MRFNASSPEHPSERLAILVDLLGKVGPGAWIEPPFYCDYGTQIELDEDVFLNFGCVLLDPGLVRIGAQTQLGPYVQLYTADHPREAAVRAAGPELAKPITIGTRVWIGGGAIVLPGVTIGDDSTIGAGSVVSRDVPSGVVAAGNPCKVIRSL